MKSTEDSALCKEMKEIISVKIQTYYVAKEVSDLLDKCTYLDPHFKTRCLRNTERALALIKEEAEDISVSLDLTDNHNRNDDSEAAAPLPKKTKGLG